MGLLILGLGGFGIGNFSGGFGAVGTVGDREVSSADYARAVSDEIDGARAQTRRAVSFAEAQRIGLDRLAMAKLIALRSLDHETAKLGLSIGDANLRDQLTRIPDFRGPDGKFSTERYDFYLERRRLSRADYEQDLRTEISRSIVQSAVLGGIQVPSTHADTLVAYYGQRRDFTWARLGKGDLDAPIPAPTDDQLKTFHKENAARFTLPARKRITYVWLTPDMLMDKVKVDEAELKKAYDARLSEFVVPEKRLVERLSFPDEAAAKAARAALDDKAKDFDTLVKDRGLKLTDVDMGDVTQSQLGDAGKDVFAAKSGDIVGPVNSDTGPALFRVNGILKAQTTTFDAARKKLREERAATEARSRIDGKIDAVEDLLAAGATLEDLAKEAGMTLGTQDWTNKSSDGPSAYEAFRSEAAKVGAKDFPTLIKLNDGGIAALRLDKDLAAELQPLDKVREDVVKAWTEAETGRVLKAKAKALLPKLTPDADLAALGLTATVEEDILRRAFIPDTPRTMVGDVFAMDKDTARVIDTPGGAILVRLDAIKPADEKSPDIVALRKGLEQQALSGLTQDLFQYFLSDTQNRAGVEINQSAIDAANARFQ